ncbi:hypothetical protein ACRAWD_18555 [Caulobacter segnis]
MPAVTNITNRLLDEGLIAEGGQAAWPSGPTGRRPSRSIPTAVTRSG